jgi:hypothetical protein
MEFARFRATEARHRRHFILRSKEQRPLCRDRQPADCRILTYLNLATNLKAGLHRAAVPAGRIDSALSTIVVGRRTARPPLFDHRNSPG